MATFNRKIQERIMNNIKIKNHKKIYFQYMIEDRDLMEFINTKNDYKKYD
jgi:hypothetical protein